MSCQSLQIDIQILITSLQIPHAVYKCYILNSLRNEWQNNIIDFKKVQLSDEQLEAAENMSGPQLLLAVPGSARR